MRDKVAAVIVTYNPDCQLYQNIEILNLQVNEVVIVDNGSCSTTMLEHLDGRNNVKVMFLRENLGIAAALNVGLKYIINQGYHWVLTMDQDSRPMLDMVEKLINSYMSLSLTQKVGIIGPNYIQTLGDYPIENIDKTDSVIERFIVITSGSLFSTSVFEKAGEFKEEYFIDEVDHEYCLRLRVLGYKMFQTKEVLMQHNLGAISRHEFLNKTITTNNHNYIRRYYQARNMIALSKQYFDKEPRFILGRDYGVLKTMAICLFFEKDRFRKLVYMLRGLADGIRNKMGKIAE